MVNGIQSEPDSNKVKSSLIDVWGEISPATLIVCGSGWNQLAEIFPHSKSIEYKNIPGMSSTTVKGHDGILRLCEINHKSILLFQGRRHWYEGDGWNPIKLPIEIGYLFGIENLILTNAAGGINNELKVGDLMILSDHLNFMSGNPLIGPIKDSSLPRFPDQTSIYNRNLINLAQKAAKKEGLSIHEGTYAALSGPAFETPAEIRALRILGADAVGMSTVPEAMLGNAYGMKVFGVSCISNMASGMTENKLSHQDVQNAADLAMPGIKRFVNCFLEQLHL